MTQHPYHAEGRHFAEQRLKDLVRTAYAERTPESVPLGPQILEAVEALPDYTKLEALPEQARKRVMEWLVKIEIGYHANAVMRMFDENRKVKTE